MHRKSAKYKIIVDATIYDWMTVWLFDKCHFAFCFDIWKLESFRFSSHSCLLSVLTSKLFPLWFLYRLVKKMNLLKYVRKQISPSDESRFVLLNFSREYEYVLKHFKCRIKNCGFVYTVTVFFLLALEIGIQILNLKEFLALCKSALNSFEGSCTQLRRFAHPYLIWISNSCFS